MKQYFKKSVKQMVTVLVVLFFVIGFVWQLSSSIFQETVKKVQEQAIIEVIENMPDEMKKTH